MRPILNRNAEKESMMVIRMVVTTMITMIDDKIFDDDGDVKMIIMVRWR